MRAGEERGFCRARIGGRDRGQRFNCALPELTAVPGSRQCQGSHGAAASHRLLGQVVQTAVDLQLWTHRDSHVHFGLEDVPLLTWLLGCLSLVLVVVTNEIVKLHEIR